MTPINTYQTVDCTKAIVQPVHNAAWPRVTLSVLRLDLIHPVLSGNKWFKLKYHLQQAMHQQKKGILTFGGAWSNHLVATAIAGRLSGLQTIGVVRGEAPARLSATLQEAKRYDMQLQYVARTVFSQEADLFAAMQEQYPHHLLVPAGGQSNTGVQGAAEILSLTDQTQYTHIACAVGTGTMITGIARSLAPHQKVIGFSSLKLADPHHNSLQHFIGQHAPANNWQLIYDYHFGGYARKKEPLTGFMNHLYREHGIPTDFVYTGKLFYGLFELISKDFFPPGSRILAIHSGGLQGNRSLLPGTLAF